MLASLEDRNVPLHTKWAIRVNKHGPAVGGTNDRVEQIAKPRLAISRESFKVGRFNLPAAVKIESSGADVSNSQERNAVLSPWRSLMVAIGNYAEE